MGSEARPPRRLIPRLPRAAWVILGGDALSAIGTGLTLPFLLIYLNQVRGINLAIAGLAASMIPLASFLGNPIGGWLADRGGARNAVVAGLLLAALGAALISLVSEPWHAFVAAGLLGLGASVIWPAQDALLAATVAREQRSAAFSVRHATLNAGLGVGSLVAAGIVDTSDASTFVIVYVIDAISFLAFIPLLLTLPNRVEQRASQIEVGPTKPQGYRVVFRDRVFRRVWLLTALVIAISAGQYHNGFPAYAARPGGISAGALGFAFAANTITVVAAQLVVLRLVAGRRRTAALRLACAGWAVTWAVTLVAGQLGGGLGAVLGFVVAMVVFGLAETLLSPTLPPMVNDLAPDELRGRYNAVSTLAWTTGFFTGPTLAGVALDAGASNALFGGLIAACVLAAVATSRLERHLPAEVNLISV